MVQYTAFRVKIKMLRVLLRIFFEKHQKSFFGAQMGGREDCL